MTDTAADDDAGTRQGKRPPRRWPWMLGGLFVLAAGLSVFWVLTRPEERAAKPPPAPPVVRSAMAARTDTLVIRQTGFVREQSTVSVAADIGGRIVRVGDDFKVGAFVEEGALLIRLETTQIEADNAVAEARVERDRQEELEDSDFASEAALQQAIVGVATAEANLAAARAALTQARERLAQATVSAPFDALVTAENAALGALVQPGAALGTLVSAEAAEIELGLTPPDLKLLGEAERALGRQVIVRDPAAPDSILAAGEVTSVDGKIAPQTRTIGLIVTVAAPFEDTQGLARPLRVDELVALELPLTLEERRVVAVPPEAVKGGGTVLVIEENTLARRQVTVLQRDEARVLIDGADLAADARVMLSDLPDAIEGQEVRLESGAEDEDASEDGG